jgi:hypothetical protein
MKKILGYLRAYITHLDPRIFLLSFLFIGIAVFINYHFGLNRMIGKENEWIQHLSWYLIFFISFSFTYLLYVLFGQKNHFDDRRFLFLLLLAPALFAWKMAYDIDLHLAPGVMQNAYWNQVVYWPLKLVVLLIALYMVWMSGKDTDRFYGMHFREFDPKPYLLMLLIMVPLIAAASTQADFLAMYPKLKNISFLARHNNGWYKLLYELSYGSDFISIELFFRGFLVLAFARWYGKEAILPMALFYCTIHFGKPLGECISSFFGGLILGVVTYHTRTIFGGLMVHLGIAWLMELGGYIGHQV